MEKRKRLLQNTLVLQEAIVSLMVSSNYLGMEVIPKTMVFEIWDYYPIFHYSRSAAKLIKEMKSSVDEIKIKSTYKIIDFNDKRYLDIEKTIH